MFTVSSPTVCRQPSNVRVYTDTDRHTIRGRNSRNVWQANDIGVTTQVLKDRLQVSLTSPTELITHVELRWQQKIPEGLRYLGDHWERGYGDLSWMSMNPDKPMPWYFFCYDGVQMYAAGVKTGAGRVLLVACRSARDQPVDGCALRRTGREAGRADAFPRHHRRARFGGVRDALRIGQPLHRDAVRQAAAAQPADLRRE